MIILGDFSTETPKSRVDIPAMKRDASPILAGEEGVMNHHPVIDCNQKPFVPLHLRVAAHRKCGPLLWDPGSTRLLLVEGQGNCQRLTGQKVWQRLRDKPVLNANVLDYLLANTNCIPESWKGLYIHFWGTLYRGGRCRFVRYLYWNRFGWRSLYNSLAYDWTDDLPAAVQAI